MTATLSPPKQTPLDLVHLINLPVIQDERGKLSVIETPKHLPFAIHRAFYLYDVEGTADRGHHAHKQQHQVFIAINGHFNLTLQDGTRTQTFHLNTRHQALHVPPMLWGTLNNFSKGAVCMVFSDAAYDEADYIRNYDEFILAVKQAHSV
jgi:dTDP-4-dehydrorhamnose 3,5-epimerase-like enzyme